MKKRKRIALITTNPEAVYQQRVMSGVFSQCNKYGYDVVVFSTLVHINHFDKAYLAGEIAIYNLINYDLFDGVILTPISLSDNFSSRVFDDVTESLQKKCHCKVVALDMPCADYEVCYTDDRGMFYDIAKHIYEVHKCKKVYFLNGVKNHEVSRCRLEGFMEYVKEHHLEYHEDWVFYGDFWYTSGEELADNIASGKVDMPEAVVCASDHMAIGLANRLVEHGIKVPEQVIITGYDVTQEAVSNSIAITSFEPPVAENAARAVDVIHHYLEPDCPMFSSNSHNQKRICIGESCGCLTDVNYMKSILNNFLYSTNRNYDKFDERYEYDLSLLIESYMYENMIRPRTCQEYYDQVHKYSYLMNPYNDFYLCLNKNWLDVKKYKGNGFSDKMQRVLHTSSELDKRNEERHSVEEKEGKIIFDKNDLLPELNEYREKPSVFYVSSIHFAEEILGYAVLACDLGKKHKINYVYHTWLRNVMNALEMLRIKINIESLSLYDSATGLFNRRGMYNKLEEWNQNLENADLLVVMADMDGLKYINDHFGHQEGDYGLIQITKAILTGVENEQEFCVRNGGDEFLLIGAGDYDEDKINQKLKKIEKKMIELNSVSGKEYEISASLGYCCAKLSKDTNIDILIGLADKRMYANKKNKKKNRK